MASHWTLALLLAISVLLGIGQAMLTCESDGTYQCVASNKCISLAYRSNANGCKNNQVCCANEDILYDNPCGGEKVCVHEDLCRTEVDFRSLEQCPNRNHICCIPEEENTLSIDEPLN